MNDLKVFIATLHLRHARRRRMQQSHHFFTKFCQVVVKFSTLLFHRDYLQCDQDSPWPICRLKCSRGSVFARLTDRLFHSYHFHSQLFLHTVKVNERFEYKLLCLIHKVFTTTQHTYFHNLISLQPRRSTRSSSVVTPRPPTVLIEKHKSLI